MLMLVVLFFITVFFDYLLFPLKSYLDYPLRHNSFGSREDIYRLLITRDQMLEVLKHL